MHASLNLDFIELSITALDYDLMVRENESLERSSARVLRQSALKSAGNYPAIFIRGENKFLYSIVPGQPVYIGRAEENDLILDATDISSKHARFGFEQGSFWVEDLGSTNGTYMNRQQISGRVTVQSGVPVVLGLKTSILGVLDDADVEKATQIKSESISKPSGRRFPVLVSVSEIARPARLVVPTTGKISIGRDPSNDIWLGVPHVSRRHCELETMPDGSVDLIDTSTNGTGYLGGMLRNGERLKLTGEPQVINFGNELTMAICFDDEQEKKFFRAKGDRSAFEKQNTVQMASSSRVTTTLDRELLDNVKSVSQIVRDTGVIEQYIIFFNSLSPATKLLFVGVVFALLLLMILIAMVLWSVLR